MTNKNIKYEYPQMKNNLYKIHAVHNSPRNRTLLAKFYKAHSQKLDSVIRIATIIGFNMICWYAIFSWLGLVK